MIPSSRTPEGRPSRCPVCGQLVWLEPSDPPGDAPCPYCGHLLWFAPYPRPPLATLPTEKTVPVDVELAAHAAWSSGDTATWITCSVVCAAMISIGDESVLSGALWLGISLPFGKVVLPRLFRWGANLSERHPNFWRDAALGWALVPGPLVGCFFGCLGPLCWNWPMTSLQGSMLGLAIGPLFAIGEGLGLATLVISAAWLVTGKRLDREP